MSKEEVIKKLEEGNLSLEEWNQLDESIRSEEDVQFLWEVNNTSGLIVPKGAKSKQDAWDLFESTVDQKEVSKKTTKSSSRFVWISGVAAALALLVWWGFLKPTVISTGSGEILSYQLPDGSEVILNAESSISFNSFSYQSNRTIKHQGEVFYKVTKGKPFMVEANEINVLVLGTSFNIIDREENIQVACETGEVRVSSEAGEVNLTKNLKTTLLGNQLTKPSKAGPQDYDRLKGEFFYQNESLGVVLKEIERQFGVEVSIEPYLNSRYTGGFSNKNLHQALQQVCLPMSLKFEVKGEKIYIK